MSLAIVEKDFILRVFSGLSQYEVSGQNGDIVLISKGGHAMSRRAHRLCTHSALPIL